MNELINCWIDEYMDEKMDGRMDGFCINRRMNEWINGWKDEWMRLFDAYLPLIALYLQNLKLINNDYTDFKKMILLDICDITAIMSYA